MKLEKNHLYSTFSLDSSSLDDILCMNKAKFSVFFNAICRVEEYVFNKMRNVRIR